MTILYIMCFGSFIGYSGAFPKLITDIFGYIDKEACEVDGTVDASLTNSECMDLNGNWDVFQITNPNAPNVFSYAWLGACVGSLIRPVGGVLSDKYGGARVTMVSIVVCAASAIGQGILLTKTRGLENPEKNFPIFLILFLLLFLCTGAMNGSTFRTIGVLFPPEQSGPVL